jgi:hypothetical protein
MHHYHQSFDSLRSFYQFHGSKIAVKLGYHKEEGPKLHYIPKYLAQDILCPVATIVQGRICLIIFQNTRHKISWVLDWRKGLLIIARRNGMLSLYSLP